MLFSFPTIHFLWRIALFAVCPRLILVSGLRIPLGFEALEVGLADARDDLFSQKLN
jgi:hypothetical protein